jgi:hypothetical protein
MRDRGNRAQTPLTLIWSALVFGERIGWLTGLVAVAVLVSVTTQRARIRPAARLGESPWAAFGQHELHERCEHRVAATPPDPTGAAQRAAAPVGGFSRS